MNRWVQRGLRTALLTGGLLAAGAGVAAADENDLTAGLLGATATVPVHDGTVLPTPVVTGTGEDLTVGSGAGNGVELPVDTHTAAGTTVLGEEGVSVPVWVTEADDAPPDPADGLTVTVPVNTSGGGTAGTTVTLPIVTGDLGEVLDGDPLTGGTVDVDLTDPVGTGPGGGLLLDLEDTVTIGGTGGTPSPGTVVQLPVALDEGRPTTVTLPLPGGTGGSSPGSGSGGTDGASGIGSGGSDAGAGSGDTGASSGGTGLSGTGAPPAGGLDGDCAGPGASSGATRVPGGDTHPATGGGRTGTARSGADPAGGTGPGDACGTGTPQAVVTRPTSSTASTGPVAAAAGVLAVAAGLLLAAGRGRLWWDRA
ncbi:hypothetical protein [Geodermatophilus sp. CPCC 205761]|uniref:hypothetical protein n=1 Tax=Geodermatophilus sp. CPCC 205761 TaxID=2936597 RepID=UPI003EECE1CF